MMVLLNSGVQPMNRFPFLYNIFHLPDFIISFSPVCLSDKQSVMVIMLFFFLSLFVVDLAIILPNAQTYPITYPREKSGCSQYDFHWEKKKGGISGRVRAWLSVLWEMAETWHL